MICEIMFVLLSVVATQQLEATTESIDSFNARNEAAWRHWLNMSLEAYVKGEVQRAIAHGKMLDDSLEKESKIYLGKVILENLLDRLETDSDDVLTPAEKEMFKRCLNDGLAYYVNQPYYKNAPAALKESQRRRLRHALIYII